jgi:hypothetical protein
MGTGRLNKQYVMLPAINDDQPDYKYMEIYMRNVEHRLLSRYIDKRLKSLQEE